MSKVLTEKFIRLKTAVGGNREVTAYEDTFGMPKEEQAHITRPNQWNTRILSELEFALNLREDGAFDEAIERALDILLKAMKADGVLNNAVCQEAEDALAPLQEEAKSYRLDPGCSRSHRHELDVELSGNGRRHAGHLPHDADSDGGIPGFPFFPVSGGSL